jgi:CubicO group peptidase (beta-lactamase class C family)
MKPITLFPITLLILLSHHSLAQHFAMPPGDSVIHLMQTHHVPVVGVGVVENGIIRSVQVFGTLDDQQKAPVNTIFNVASVTKPVVFMMTLRLVSDGQWDLDEPLAKYWVDPEVKDDPRHATLTTRHVLTHQSGLPNWKGHEPDGKLRFAFVPGADWKYSGEGFEYLRQALQRKFNKPLEQLADSLIFKPFGMNDTRFSWDHTMDASRYANRHRADGSAFELETWNEANPSNLLLTTVQDYCLFAVHVMKRTGIKKSVYNEMIKPQVTLKNKRQWGLGWPLMWLGGDIHPMDDRQLALVHSGRNPGINTIVVLLPESQSALVVFTNGENGDVVYKHIIGATVTGREIVKKMN